MGRCVQPSAKDAQLRHYYVKDHLGSVRTVVDATGEVKEVRDYYPFGLRMPGRSVTAGTPAREDFTGHELDAATGLHYAGARYYMSAFGRWTTTDPLADKYPSLSPYNYVANNPLRLVDPDGREIRVCHTTTSTDEEGNSSEQQECVTYSAGVEYEGDNTFLQQAVGALNKLAGAENGLAVLNTLIESDNVFNIANSKSSKERTLSFVGNNEGGGVINAAGIEELGEGQLVRSLAHESFHAYQHESGLRGGSVNSEVGAYLFGYSTSLSLGYPTTSLAKADGSAAAAKYGAAVQALVLGGRFNEATYGQAINNFKAGSVANATGVYSNFPVLPISPNPLIRSFFPLLR